LARAAEFAKLMRDLVGYAGGIMFDTSRPGSAPRKLLDVSRFAKLGWTSRAALRDGVAAADRDFLSGGAR
jgi:GDP-L-fucose synthase